MALNTVLARRVLDAITAHEDRFDQRDWIHPNADAVRQRGGLEVSSDIMLSDDPAPLCGTTLCVAGWAMVLSGWRIYDMDIPTFVRRFGSETAKEVFWRPDHAVDFEELDDPADLPTSLQITPRFFRTPTGQFLISPHGTYPGQVSYAAEAGRLLGLTSPHGQQVASTLFAGGRSKAEVVDALTAMAAGKYPTGLRKFLDYESSEIVDAADERLRLTALGLEGAIRLQGHDGPQLQAYDQARDLAIQARDMLANAVAQADDPSVLTSDVVPVLEHDMWMTGKPRPGQPGATTAIPSSLPF